MGNEMGNNNVSGLQEEEKARTEEDQGKFLQDDNHAVELKGENRTKLEAGEKDLHEKRKINENGEATDFHEVLVLSETPLADLAVEKPQEENQTSNGKEEHATEFKPLVVPVEIPPDSDDADLRSEDQEFVSSDISDFLEKTNLDDSLSTTAEHGSEKEMLIGGGYIETQNQTVDSEAGSGERDPNSDQQEAFPAEQVAVGISILQSENGHLESNDVAPYDLINLEVGTGYIETQNQTVDSEAGSGEGDPNSDQQEVFPAEQVVEGISILQSEDGHLESNDVSPYDLINLEVGTGYIETKNQTVDSEAGSGERDPNSDQQEVVQAEQVAEGISIPQSENGHVESNDVAENMYLCPGDQNVATIMDTLLVKVKADEDEFETLSCEDKSDVFSPEEVDSQNEHNVGQSPLNVLQPPQEAHKSAVEASYQQLEALNLPLEDSEAPTDASNSPLETLEPPIEAEASESPQEKSPQEESHPQPLALTLLLKASDSPLEESEAPLNALNPTMETLEPLPKALESPLEASEQQPMTLTLLVKPSDPSLEASNSPLEASESPSEDLETPVEDSKSILETQLEASELPLEASDSLLEASESQLEAFPQASSINSSQEVYEPHDKTINVTEALLLITSERQIGEIKLSSNQAQCFEENDQKFETFESKTSQSQQMCVGSDCYENDGENALAASIKKDYAVIESDVHRDDPKVAFLNQTLKPCLEERPAMEENMLLTEESIPIGREVESKGHQGDHIKTHFCDQELKDLKTDDFIATQLEFLATEIVSKKSAEKSAHEFDFTNGTGENFQIEDLEVKCDEYQVTLADKSLKLESNEVADTMSEIEAVSTESNVTDYKHDEDRPREEIGDKGKESPLENDRGDIIGKTMSPNSSNDAQDVPPYFSDSKALEDKNELITDSQSEFLIITERYQASPSVAIVQIMMPTPPEQEAEQNIQETSVMAETSSLLFDEETAKGEETVEKLMTEPSSDNANNHVEFRKSPSFHFDLSIGSKCEESDHTPLLCNDKTAGRSLISRDEAMLQNNSEPNDYNSPQDDALFVEEKTIRMERSDSERPSTPFLSFLQKEESAEILITPERQEKNAADKKTKRDPWTVIHKTFALTSPRDSNGKRKAKSSIFSTCICCASKTP